MTLFSNPVLGPGFLTFYEINQVNPTEMVPVFLIRTVVHGIGSGQLHPGSERSTFNLVFRNIMMWLSKPDLTGETIKEEFGHCHYLFINTQYQFIERYSSMGRFSVFGVYWESSITFTTDRRESY